MAAWATLNKAIYRFNHRYSVVAFAAVVRFTSMWDCVPTTFPKVGAVRNESGFYMGVEAAPLNELKLSAYVDYFLFSVGEVLGYLMLPKGWKGRFQADWVVSRKWELSGRYQLKRKERYGQPYLYHKLKVQAQCMPSKVWEWRGVARYTRVRDVYGRHVGGYMGGSILKWKDRKNRLNVAGSCVYFDSEDYKAPMSFYEPSLLYAFSFMTMYGQGMRAAVNARWNVAKHWMLMCKYGATGYFDRDEIGEGCNA